MSLTKLRMPQLGESVTEGTVDRWLKKEGDFVRRDEPLVEVVTDKVNAEIPSPFEGRLTRIAVQEGTTVTVGTEIAQIEIEGAEGAVAADTEAAPDAAVAAPAAAATMESRPSNGGPAAAAQTGVRLSPAVRRLAEEHGIDPTMITGTG